MPDSVKRPPLILTDDAWIMNEPGPVTLESMRERVVDPVAGTGASLWWNVGNSEVYFFETEVGEIWGQDRDLDRLEGRERIVAENVRHLIATAGGPLTALSGLCREAGVSFFPRVRMNSHYDYYPRHSIGHGSFRRDNPHLRIGRPGEQIPTGGIDWAVHHGLDYAYPEVRDHMFAIITELLERFDIDGVEIDFNRHPTFFRRAEQTQNAYLMTDLVRRVRRRQREIEEERGRRFQLAVRVPPTLADARRIGLDVETWMLEGLVDIVTAGIGWIPFEMPIGEFVRAAADCGHPIHIYGCVEGLRPISDDRALCAAATRFHRAGAGVYLYNFFHLPPAWQRQMLPVLADPQALARTSKRYELDHSDRNHPVGHGGAFLNALPPVQIPMVLAETSRPPRLRLEIADDVEAAAAEGTLNHSVLALLVENFAPGDELAVTFNGHAYPACQARIHYTGRGNGWPYLEQTCSIQFDLDAPALRQGINDLEISLRSLAPRGAAAPILTGVDITLTYHQS